MLAVAALLDSIFMRFYFIKNYAKQSSTNNLMFFLFVVFTILLVVADVLAFKPTWSFCRLAMHMIVLVGFALTAMIVSFGLKDIDKRPRLKRQEREVHSLTYWIFVGLVVIRLILFCF